MTPVTTGDPLPPRTLVIGGAIDGDARAYPREAVASARVILDELHSAPIAVLEADDRHSVRVFSRVVDGATVDLLQKVDSAAARFIDERTGSEFDFTGRSLSGPLAGRQLARVPHLSDYWFRLAPVSPGHVGVQGVAAAQRPPGRRRITLVGVQSLWQNQGSALRTAVRVGRASALPGNHALPADHRNAATTPSHASGCSSAGA